MKTNELLKQLKDKEKINPEALKDWFEYYLYFLEKEELDLMNKKMLQELTMYLKK